MGIKRPAPSAVDYLDDDEEEDTRPKRRASRDEDEDERPARRSVPKQRAAADDDDDEDERPARRRRPARDEDEDDEDEKPRRRSRRDEDEDELDDEDEDEEAPRSSVVQKGWGAAKKLKNAGGDFANEFKFSDEGILVKFVGDEPAAIFKQHWIERTGKKSFMCIGKGCPLCRAGDDNPRPKFVFNVAVLSAGEPEMQALIAGPRLLGQIETAHTGKSGPIDKHYWELSRSGKKGNTSYSLQVVKERDLEDDWELDPSEVEKAIRALKPYDESHFKPSSKADLLEVARELSDDD